ncbi:MAG: enoyl-CoA hydratase [Rhodospirillales bacterium]
MDAKVTESKATGSGSSAVPAESGAPILLCEQSGAVAVLTLNRPAARNALSLDMLSALGAALARLGADASVHVIIITGAGTGFCAGHDLKEMTAARTGPGRGRAFFAQTMQACADVMQAVVRCPKPVIAAVHGIATAAGCQLAASCDLAVAAEDARFATPGVNIGLFCSTPMVALSRAVGAKHALEMLLTGDFITARQAHTWGLVNRVVPADQVLAEARALAEKIASKSPLVLKIGKEAFHRQRELDLNAAYAYTAEVMVENMMARDAEEGIGAFLEKRKPVWESPGGSGGGG